MGDKLAVNDGGNPPSVEVAELLNEIQRLRTELAQSQDRLASLDHLAHRDPLVDLFNRRAFMGQLARSIERMRDVNEAGAIIFADVDGLKPINDDLGHAAGDKILQDVAALIKKSVRNSDFVARLAGDEFAVLLERTDELRAWQLALRIVEAVDDHKFIISSKPLTVSLAVGVAAIWPTDTPASALGRADQEMYRIKAIGRRSSRPSFTSIIS